MVLFPPHPGLLLAFPYSCPHRIPPGQSEWQREILSAHHHLHHPGGPSLPARGPPGWASAKHQGWAQRLVFPQWSQGKIDISWKGCRVSVWGTDRAGGMRLCAATCPMHHPIDCLAVGHQQQGVERNQRWGEVAMGRGEKCQKWQSGAGRYVGRKEMAKAGSALGSAGGALGQGR